MVKAQDINLGSRGSSPLPSAQSRTAILQTRQYILQMALVVSERTWLGEALVGDI